MYDVLALTMQIVGRPKADVERALMSHVDFAATDVDSTLLSAAYLARFRAEEQALKLYRQASDLEPTRPEGYILGLRLARELKDSAGVQWAATGVLQKAWRKNYEELHREAEDAAFEAERALREAGKQTEADALRDAMAGPAFAISLSDCNGRATAISTCPWKNPWARPPPASSRERPAAGSIGTTATVPIRKTAMKSMCAAFGMPGVYVVRIRRIDGSIVGNRAQLTVVRNQGSKKESTQTFVVKLKGDLVAVRLSVPDGRRRQLDSDRPPTNARTSQLRRLCSCWST